VSNVAKKKSIDSAQIERETADLFSRCLQAFHVFADLQQLSEDMRVLSLNAELAAGRAGEKGAGVRALTQYTRELVNRLNGYSDEMAKLKGQMYSHSADAMRVLRENGMLERAEEGVRVSGAETDSAALALEKVGAAQFESLETTLERVRLMIDCVNKLDSVSGGISNVGSQAASISTNVAIEAALAGPFEGEFRQVSSAMQEYVDQLRAMSDSAVRAIRDAITIGQDLHMRTRERLNVS